MNRPQPFDNPIYVTRPFLPPLEDYCAGLKDIWDSAWLTNNGPIVQRFTAALEGFFQTPNVCVFNNGTLALQIALEGLHITGEVITTPFTFVATSHALFWNKIRPVFVDIEPEHYTLDPQAVEAAITPWTTAILAVHVFGYPCQLSALAGIARRHNLALIYDAAHAFGVEIDGTPIAHFGDVSMFSFHATKLFHSIEGGALTFQNGALKSQFDYLKNFGFKNEIEVVLPGTNAKMNEFQALMGLQVLKHIPEITARRRAISALYREGLADIPGIKCPPRLPPHITENAAYFPIEVDRQQFGLSRDELYETLKTFGVFTRRYFYPLVCDFVCYQGLRVDAPLTIARGVAERILTLPIYDDLNDEDVGRICELIRYYYEQAQMERMVEVAQ